MHFVHAKRESDRERTAEGFQRMVAVLVVGGDFQEMA